MSERLERPCAIEHLEAVVRCYNRWSVAENGEPKEFSSWGDTNYAALDEIEEYVCNNCCEYFTPTDRDNMAALAEAWQAALAHLGNTEVAA